MSTVTDAIDNQVNTAQELIRKMQSSSLRDIPKQAWRPGKLHLRIVVPGVMIAALAAGVGLVLYRRRSRSLAERLQNAIPDSIRELPVELRAHLKRPLERAVRAL